MFTTMLVLVIFASDQHFGLVDVGFKGLKGNTPVGREGEVVSTVILTVHGTSFHGLNTVKRFPVFHGMQRIIIVFTAVWLWTPF
jgi:hypothetical protein